MKGDGDDDLTWEVEMVRRGSGGGIRWEEKWYRMVERDGVEDGMRWEMEWGGDGLVWYGKVRWVSRRNIERRDRSENGEKRKEMEKGSERMESRRERRNESGNEMENGMGEFERRERNEIEEEMLREETKRNGGVKGKDIQ